jgi:hypothetical protein
MKSDLPCGSGPRDQQYDRQREAAEPLGSEIRGRQDTKHSKNEWAGAEDQGVWPEVTRHDRADDRSKERPDKALPRDCVITIVVIGAQYASGSWNNRATSREATHATAVRAECTKIGHAGRLDSIDRHIGAVYLESGTKESGADAIKKRANKGYRWSWRSVGQSDDRKADSQARERNARRASDHEQRGASAKEQTQRQQHAPTQ